MRWPTKWPHPALVFVVLAWGINFPMVKLAYHGFTPPAVALIRCLLQIPVAFLVVRLLGRNLVIERRFWLGVGLGGLINTGLYMVFFLEGMKRTSAGQGAIALATAPIFVAILSGFLGQDRIGWSTIFGSILAFAGVAVAEAGSHGVADGNAVGTLLCLISALVWAVSISIMRPALNKVDALAVFAWSLIAATLVLVPYGLHDTLALDWASVPVEGWVGMAYMVVVAGVGGFTAYYMGVTQVGAAKASMTSYIIPIVAAFAAWPILGSAPHPSHLVGLVLVLAGVGVVNYARKASSPVLSKGKSIS